MAILIRRIKRSQRLNDQRTFNVVEILLKSVHIVKYNTSIY